jgi:large repetitive protein
LRYSLNGGTFQSGNLFTKLENALYTVTVQDANGCTATTTATVNVPVLGATASTAKPITCFGGNDGSVSIQPTGGVPPYAYTLNGGTETSDSVFSNLNAGPHAVTVRDDAGKIFVISNITVQQPDAYLITVTVKGNDISVSFIGNNPPYTFETKGLGNKTEDLSNGSYTLVATDGSGCTQETVYEVNYTPADFDMIGERVKPCDLNYRVTLTPQEGLPPYLYSSNGTDYQKDSVFNDITAGIKAFYVKDDAGTIAQKNINLPDVPAIQATTQVNGDTIFVTKIQGVGLFTYSLDSINFQTSGVFPDLTPGVYRVFVRDALGCVLVLENVKVVLGLLDPAAVWGLKVSPNPGSGLFRLSFAQSPKILYVNVLDAIGRQLHDLYYSPVGDAFEVDLDLRHLPSGAYWLRISDGVGVGGVRVVKE